METADIENSKVIYDDDIDYAGMPQLQESDDEDDPIPEVQRISHRKKRGKGSRDTSNRKDDISVSVQNPQPTAVKAAAVVQEAATQQGAYNRQYRLNDRAERYTKRGAKAAVSVFAYEEYNQHNDSDGEYNEYLHALFADWSNPSDTFYYSYATCELFQIIEECNMSCESVQQEMKECQEYGFKAVTKDVPRSWSEALKHPQWGEPARIEKDTLLEKSIVRVDRNVAMDAVHQGADIVNLFPVYEEKVKEGRTVYKVRLVGDGRNQKNAGTTYSETPSREEFRIFMHIIAHNGWDFYHCDEKRAFLSAKYAGDIPVFARLGPAFYRVAGALYGLKASPRHYQKEVLDRLTGSMEFTRLGLCSCIYVRQVSGYTVLVFDYVDDFIWSGTDSVTTEKIIAAFRTIAVTTDVIKNPTSVLGMSIVRDFDKHTISLSLSTKIDELMEKVRYEYGVFEKYKVHEREPYVPLASTSAHIDDTAFEDGTVSSEDSRFLDRSEILILLSIVGGLIWQTGIRWDVLYSHGIRIVLESII